MKTAVYAGTFDPITNGHVDVIERALKIFDNIIVAVGVNTQKKTLFTSQERVDQIAQAVSDKENVSVEAFDGLLVDFLKEKNCSVILRGLRIGTDFDFEFQHALLNKKLDESVESVFIMTKDEYSFLTSSAVKEIAQCGGDVSKFVPQPIAKSLRSKFHSST